MAAPIAWQPEGEPLKQLVGYLKDALSAHNQEAQRHATHVSYRGPFFAKEHHHAFFDGNLLM